ECYSVQDLLKLAQKLTSQSSSFVEKRTQEEIDLEVGVLYPVEFDDLPDSSKQKYQDSKNTPRSELSDPFKDFSNYL
ncbi:MAG: hypothetical protein U9Q15_05530, partial [Patescibacteria group bacterium]|nr:hypothetical protein [Patescibacteria group bacterium]